MKIGLTKIGWLWKEKNIGKENGGREKKVGGKGKDVREKERWEDENNIGKENFGREEERPEKDAE